MYYGDMVLYNDEQRSRLQEASRSATQGWRFRDIKSRGVRALSKAVKTLSKAARDALDAARRGLERARDWRLPTLTEQR